MARPEVNIIVCLDARRCLRRRHNGRSGQELYDELRRQVELAELTERVQVTPCQCIFGCSYGPRVDVAQRWSGEKRLYGAIEGPAAISRRGRVQFHELPADLSQLARDNLPVE